MDRDGEENKNINKMDREQEEIIIMDGGNIVEDRESEIEIYNRDREHNHNVEQANTVMDREREYPGMGREPEMDTYRIMRGDENTVMDREQDKGREQSDTVGKNTDQLLREQEQNRKEQIDKNDKNTIMEREKEKTIGYGKGREQELVEREREYYEDREHHKGDRGHEGNIDGDKETEIAIGHMLMDREKKMVNEPKNTLMDRENEYGHMTSMNDINYLSLFKLFIASMLKNNNDGEAESSTSSSEWKECMLTERINK